MASTTDKLKDPNLSEQEQDAIIGAFVRRQENERLRQRWEQKLATEHGLRRIAPPRKKRTVTIRKIGLVIMTVAAGLLLLFAVLPLLNAPAGEELLAAYVSEVSINNTRELADTDQKVLRQQVADAFSAGNYPAAVSAAERLGQLPDARPEDELNLGKAYLRNGNFEQADETLRNLIRRDTDFTTDARFTLSLSLLSQGKTEAALGELGLIKETDGAKIYAKARKLINDIE